MAQEWASTSTLTAQSVTGAALGRHGLAVNTVTRDGSWDLVSCASCSQLSGGESEQSTSKAVPLAPHRSTSCRSEEQLFHDSQVPVLGEGVWSGDVFPVTVGPKLVLMPSVFHHLSHLSRSWWLTEWGDLNLHS